MWKLGILFVIVALKVAFAKDIILNCIFLRGGHDLYQCKLFNITVLDPSANVRLFGTHHTNKTNANVKMVEIDDSNTPFIIPQLFTTFPNLRYLSIRDSKLVKINIPPEAKLIQLNLNQNKISTIQSNSLRNQTELRTLDITDSGIKFIAENAFADLNAVISISLMGNEIQTLAARTLAPLTKVELINLAENLLTTIDEDTFSNNANLEILYLEKNRIDKIHANAFENLRSLSYIGLKKNLCATKTFMVRTDEERNILRNSLQRCFSNHASEPTTKRYLKVQCTGTLTISEEHEKPHRL